MSKSEQEGKIERLPSGLTVGEGAKGMCVYDDTMTLGLAKTVKQAYALRTTAAAIIAGGLTWAAYHFNSLPLAALTGAFSTIAIQQGIKLADAAKDYSKALEEAVLHGWASREELKKIDGRYIY